MALRVLKLPRTSISMTDLKALGESWDIEARKLPAAPALRERGLEHFYILKVLVKTGDGIARRAKRE